MTLEAKPVPLLAARQLTKSFGSIEALRAVDLQLNSGEVHCLLGDNGAGKSTLIKLLSGEVQPSSGELQIQGQSVKFAHPSEAITAGIATVYQDLAIIPMISIVRNFFLGREPQIGKGLLKRFDFRFAEATVMTKMAEMGINIRSPRQPAGTLSGGQRQVLAIARAVYFGAKVLILDEPTSALGVTQTANVLQVIDQVRSKGVGVIFITHNVRHAYSIGDQFTVLQQGCVIGHYQKKEIEQQRLHDLMAGDQGSMRSMRLKR